MQMDHVCMIQEKILLITSPDCDSDCEFTVALPVEREDQLLSACSGYCFSCRC